VAVVGLRGQVERDAGGGDARGEGAGRGGEVDAGEGHFGRRGEDRGGEEVEGEW